MTEQVSIPGIDYTVVIAPNLVLELPERLAKRYPQTHMVLLTDNRVWDLYGLELAQRFADCNIDIDDIVIPEGEASKSLEVYSAVIEELHHYRFDEESLLINLGGGMITDLGGFVASSYRQGVRSVSVPPTLFGQQEAAFGTHVGINTNWPKNFIGGERRPDAVYSDTAVLASLPRRDLASGLAATLKIAISHDLELFEFLESSVGRVLDEQNVDVLHEIVLRASRTRLQSEQYQGGQLGVAFAHALEAGSRYSGVLHGEALAWGMALAVAISGMRQLMTLDMMDRVLHLMAACELPPELPKHALQRAIAAMDLGSSGQMVVPISIGRVTTAIKPSVADVYAAMELVRHHPAFSDIRPDYRAAA